MLSLIASVGVLVGGLAAGLGVSYAVKTALYPWVLCTKPNLKDKNGNAVRISEARRSPDDDLWEYKDSDGVWQSYESTVLLRRHKSEEIAKAQKDQHRKELAETTWGKQSLTPGANRLTTEVNIPGFSSGDL